MNSTVARRAERDVVRWYPLRIFHSSAKRQSTLKEELDKESAVETTYVPQRLIDSKSQQYAPALVNYIFVRISLSGLSELKGQPRFGQLRYIMQMRETEDGGRVSTVAYITDREMDNFQQVIANLNGQVELIENNAFAMRPGQKVKITEGTFAGVDGTLKSIRKHLCVVVPLGGIISVAITGIHRKHIQPLESGEAKISMAQE